MNPPRRVVTGLDAEGRSCVIIDGPARTVIWSNADTPADGSGTADTGGDVFAFPTSGAVFTFFDLPPHSEPFLHASDTFDYGVIFSGEATFITETGETLLRAGDVIVDRANMHAWRNDSDEPCRIIGVIIPSRPVGKGATVSGAVSRD